MHLAMLRALPAQLAPGRGAALRVRRSLHSAPAALRQTRAQSERGDLPATRREGRGGALSPFGSPVRMGSLFRDLEQEMDSLMRGFGGGLGLPALEGGVAPAMRSLAVDIQDKGDAFLVHADVPGMEKDDVKIKVSPDHVLTISGERKSESKQEEGGLVRMERSYGSFFRSFRLPDNVDLEGIKAEINKGELQLRIPKTEVQEETKEIEIPVEGK